MGGRTRTKETKGSKPKGSKGKKRADSLGVKAAKGFDGRIFVRWAKQAVLKVAESEITGRAKKKAASDHIAKLVADAIPDTPTLKLVEAFAVPVARAIFETAIQKAYDELKAAGQVQ